LYVIFYTYIHIQTYKHTNIQTYKHTNIQTYPLHYSTTPFFTYTILCLYQSSHIIISTHTHDNTSTHLQLYNTLLSYINYIQQALLSSLHYSPMYLKTIVFTHVPTACLVLTSCSSYKPSKIYNLSASLWVSN